MLDKICGSPYFNEGYLVDSTSQNKVTPIIGLIDLNEAKAAAGIGYVLASLPLDLDTNSSCVVGEHERSDLAYMPIVQSEAGYQFNGDAIKSPIEVRVINPTVGATQYGDILNRHYEVQTEVAADIVHPADSMWE